MRPVEARRRSVVWRLLAVVASAVLLGSASSAKADDSRLQIHGFIEQDFALSEGNQLVSNSNHGSFKLYSAGITASVQLGPRLLASAQLLVRRFGDSDDGKLRLDYALLDYQLLSHATARLGIRVGRVRNPLGLYNETRDVVFTRPSILLPQSLYSDSLGLRDIEFAAEGGHLYGDFDHGGQNTSFTLAILRSLDASAEARRNFSTAPAIQSLHVRSPYIGRVLNEWTGGKVRLGVTLIRADLDFRILGLGSLASRLQWAILSGQVNLARLSLTSEYSRTRITTHLFGQRNVDESEGAYLQAQLRFDEHWSALGRYDVLFNDRSDRDGRDFEAQTGMPRYLQFSHDWVLGARWVNGHWGAWTEVHFFDGAALVPGIENPNRSPASYDRHWRVALIAAGYRF